MKILIALLFPFALLATTYTQKSGTVDKNHFSYTGTHADDAASAVEIDESTGFTYRLKITDAKHTEFGIAATNYAINTDSDTFYKEDHGMVTGAFISVTCTPASSYPTGVTGTPNYVIRVSDDVFKLASSRAYAIAGTPSLNLGSQGTGTYYFYPTTTAGSIFLQYSVDESNWVNITAFPITAATYNTTVTNAYYNWLRIAVEGTGGQVGIDMDVNHK